MPILTWSFGLQMRFWNKAWVSEYFLVSSMETWIEGFIYDANLNSWIKMQLFDPWLSSILFKISRSLSMIPSIIWRICPSTFQYLYPHLRATFQYRSHPFVLGYHQRICKCHEDTPFVLVWHHVKYGKLIEWLLYATVSAEKQRRYSSSIGLIPTNIHSRLFPSTTWAQWYQKTITVWPDIYSKRMLWEFLWAMTVDSSRSSEYRKKMFLYNWKSHDPLSTCYWKV